MCGLGWKSLGVLELTALPSIEREALTAASRRRRPAGLGGNTFYLCHWMRESGLADVFPSLRRETVYVRGERGEHGLHSDFGESYDGPALESDQALALVGFSLPRTWITRASRTTPWTNLKRWAAG